MAKYSKLGYGRYSNIDTAIANGKLDGKDIVITSDTSELIYIRDDKTKQIIRSRIQRFDSENDAKIYLNSASDTYAGQLVAIKDDSQKYQIYTVQPGESGFDVESIISSIDAGFIWEEF